MQRTIKKKISWMSVCHMLIFTFVPRWSHAVQSPECVMIERCHNGFNLISRGNLPGNQVVHMPLVLLTSHSTGELCDA